MKLFVNEKQVDNAISEDATLAVALTYVQNNCIGDDQVIAAVYVDKQELTADNLNQWKNRPISDFQEAIIDAPTRKALAILALQTIAEGLNQSTSDRSQIVELLNQGQSAQAMQKLGNYTQMWNSAQQTIANVSKLLEKNLLTMSACKNQASQPSVQDRVTELTSQLQELKNALQAGDMVLVADILNYEYQGLTKNWTDMLEYLALTVENSW